MDNSYFEKLIEILATQKTIISNQESQGRVLDRHTEKLERHAEILERNTVIVDEHHKRSTMLEDRFSELKAEVDEISEKYKTIKNLAKFITWLGGFGGLIVASITIMKYLGVF